VGQGGRVGHVDGVVGSCVETGLCSFGPQVCCDHRGPGSLRDLDAGHARLRAVAADIATLALPKLCDELVERLVHGRPEDDVALVAIRLTGPAA